MSTQITPAEHDVAEALRLQELVETNARPAPAGALTTEQMQELYTVEGFLAPFCVVRRKADGQLGSLRFTHHPRYYFDFTPDTR